MTEAAPRPRTLVGTARVVARAADAVGRAGAGDVVVTSQTDVDPRTARALAEAGVAAFVTTGPLVSRRFPSAGPEVLADAGVVLVGDAGAAALEAVADGRVVRLEGGALRVEDAVVATGSVVEADDLHAEMRLARAGLTAHLDTFTANAVDLLRREQGLVVEGEGLPRLRTSMTGRPVLVVARDGDRPADLSPVRRFLKQQRPAVVAVGAAADDVLALGTKPDVVVVSTDDPGAVPTLEGLRAARDVVVRTERGDHPRMVQSLESLGADPLTCETTVRAEDLALLLAAADDPATVVGVGVRADLHELLDHRRGPLAGTFLARLRLGRLLVDADTVSRLSGSRTRRLATVLVVGLVALALGIVLGLGPLGGDGPDAGPGTTAAQPGDGADGADGGGGPTSDDGGPDADGTTSAGTTAYLERFAAALGARDYAAGLATAPVALVAMPGADRDLLRAASDQVKAAGGRVTGRFVVQGDLLDEDDAVVEEATAALVAQTGVVVEPGTPVREVAGRLLGEAVAATGGAVVPPDQTSTAIREGLGQAGLVASPSVPVADAPLVLAVLGPGDDLDEDQADAQAAVLRGLTAGATGTVVLGDEDSAATGTLAALRAGTAPGPLATVDDPGTSLGPVSAVLALIGVLAGRTGAFGAASADGALPLG